MQIREFRPSDSEALVRLWRECGLLRPWNDPLKDIHRKQAARSGWFLVGETGDLVMASAMVGYDGHRGSVYYLAVAPEFQGRGYGAVLMKHAEELLLALGCPKINLMLREDNQQVQAFYRDQDYTTEAAIVLGKRLIPDH